MKPEYILKRLRKIVNLDSEDIEEIYLSAGGHGLKPGAGRRFPEEKPNPGNSLNAWMSDGPNMFPKEEDF